jgi:iron complex transport system permease protein
LAALIGGNLLLMADLLARNIIQPNGLPTGILVAVIGAPYFIYLIIKK